MKISYGWLKDYLDVELPVDRVSEILTDTGLEVEGVEEFETIKGGLKGVVVGQVKSCIQHPNADKLKCTTVEVANGEILSIVCGAPNVAEGQKVLVATVGTTIYLNSGESFKIKKSKIRGEVSEGMICAEDELGLGDSHDGIMVLPEESEIGMAASKLFSIENDAVIEIGLTPNRTDAMCHYGVARDLRAGLLRKGENHTIQLPSVSTFKVDNNS
ncbi:MAG: phenylalanine--tRNA ligase subunit beta, partial [Schleiferiaceae bacterium]|nr:phenylalanine--tRNA ligase subunit beta [Schleiferiaceae bacterium]